MNLIEQLRPKNFDEVLGHESVKLFMKRSFEAPRSLILQGQVGCGKTTLACLYKAFCSQYISYMIDGPATDTEEIRMIVQRAYSAGPIILVLDEIQYLTKKQQQLLLAPIESNKLILVATTTEPVSLFLHPGIRSRLSVFVLKPVDPALIMSTLSKVVKANDRKVDFAVLGKIALESNGDVRHSLIALEHLLLVCDGEVTAEDYAALNSQKVSKVTVEEYKSALQKSIRGSDTDAAALYALALMDMGELEALCRRLKVIVSEDIGLANPSGPLIVNECISNALTLGMPEARYPVLHAVTWMALQPKSNSLAVMIQRFEGADVPIDIIPPDNIRRANARDYVYPHEFPNHWVRQNYLPEAMQGLVLYQAQSNKTETAYDEYWRKIKNV